MTDVSLIGLTEASRQTGVPRSTIRKMVMEGRVHGHGTMVGANGRTIIGFDPNRLDELRAAHVPARPRTPGGAKKKKAKKAAGRGIAPEDARKQPPLRPVAKRIIVAAWEKTRAGLGPEDGGLGRTSPWYFADELPQDFLDAMNEDDDTTTEDETELAELMATAP